MTVFANLEPHHTIEHDATVHGEPVIAVLCPFTDEDGEHYVSSWDARCDPDEVNCLFCEFLAGGWTDHGCLDSGDRDTDEP